MIGNRATNRQNPPSTPQEPSTTKTALPLPSTSTLRSTLKPPKTCTAANVTAGATPTHTADGCSSALWCWTAGGSMLQPSTTTEHRKHTSCLPIPLPDPAAVQAAMHYSGKETCGAADPDNSHAADKAHQVHSCAHKVVCSMHCSEAKAAIGLDRTSTAAPANAVAIDICLYVHSNRSCCCLLLPCDPPLSNGWVSGQCLPACCTHACIYV